MALVERSSGTATRPRVWVGRVSSLGERALTLTAHGYSYTPRDAPLFTPANRGPCGTRHIHAWRRKRAPKLACHADRTQTCLPC
eukprot:6680914-Prymnesium_polylepis.1